MSKQNKMQNKALKSGERQVHDNLKDIERHHLWRYNEALKYIVLSDKVLDLCCGIGYGSYIMAQKAYKVVGIDDSQEAIDYANIHYKLPNIEYKCMSALDWNENFDVIVALEALEHIKNEKRILELIANNTKKFIFSMPHCSKPLNQYPWHWRHYSEKDIKHKLEILGFSIERLDLIEGKRGIDIFGAAYRV